MDTAWIQVFVLTVAECVAPAGKTVCQEQQFDLQFLTRADCEVALEQLVSLKEESSSVIIDRNRTRCLVSARESEVFASLGDVNQASSNSGDWKDPDPDSGPAVSAVSHSERLEALPNCEDYDGQGACRVGNIIIEGHAEGHVVEIWQREQ